MTSGGLPPNKQNLNHHGQRSEQPQPPQSLRRQTVRKFVKGGLIVNEGDATIPVAEGNRSHISAPHNAPSTPHIRLHLHSTRKPPPIKPSEKQTTHDTTQHHHDVATHPYHHRHITTTTAAAPPPPQPQLLYTEQ